MPSRKHSASPPDNLIFFVDRSLGKEPLISRLRQRGWKVHAHDDLFKPGADDTEWLEYCGRRGLLVLTKDERIRYRPAEKAMLLEHNCRCFVLTAGSITSREIADAFEKAARTIVQIAGQEAGPFLACVDRRGKVTLNRRRLRQPPD